MKPQQAEPTFKEKLTDGLTRHWKAVTIVLAAVVVLMAGILVADYVRRNRLEESAMLSEEIQEAYQDWMQEPPESRDNASLESLIEEALAEYPRFFAAQRALFTRGLMAMDDSEWDAAAADFLALADGWKDSYLAPVSLFNAAAALEESGDIEGAVEAWRAIADDYAAVSPDAPEALFNIGRVREGQGGDEEALEAYEEVASRFPDSRWTDLSKSRILIIESR